MAAEPIVEVDVVILSRDARPLDPRVERGLASQPGVRLRIYRLTQPPDPAQINRWESIAAKRNVGKGLGNSPWIMFLDDDVELSAGTIVPLLAGLRAAPQFAALAADYRDRPDDLPARHVTMGATLFRRRALQLIQFRWEPGRCECQCCCDDLRRHALGISYAPGVRARHWQASDSSRRAQPKTETEGQHLLPPFVRGGQGGSRRDVGAQPLLGCVLAAFNRRHLGKFRNQFLASLRRAGNRDRVLVAGYGLYPSEQSLVNRFPGVTLRAFPDSPLMPPIRRLLDFQSLLAALPPATPVAYWDAADVFIQDTLAPLWQLVRANPDRLLAVREPCGYPRNVAVTRWSRSIIDPVWRERAFELLKVRPFLNSGFAAATAATMLRYLREAHRMRHSSELLGSTDWGDQMALNLYCHLDPTRWLEIDEGWNYCTHDRPQGEVRVRADGRVVSWRGTTLYAVHGNAHSLRKLELYGY